ncbi:uncharacterized protein K02A2.6-like [Saccostrea cucullata]|uniref:uncharacterized protein K02A2.6-like n=1 Tax=Saccostrea cuccullata TaxID=36930 RepID=UPI002ED573C2
MDITLPLFPQFDPETDKINAGPRWDRWIGRLENLFIALKLVNPVVPDGEEPDQNVIKSIDDRKRALLLHYVGERTYDIYEAQKGTTTPDYSGTKKVLTDYFRPRKNTQMEIYNFRCYKQKEGQSLDEFLTELRKLSKNCEFADTDSEILSQIIQNCRSNQLRRRALREADKTLDEIIQLGRAMEISDSQATAMERLDTASVNKVFNKRPNRHHSKPVKQRNHVSKPKHKGQCWNCGGPFPHSDHPCPAKGQKCHDCHKVGHYRKMCRNKKPQKVRLVNKEDNNQDYSDSDSDGYCYGVKLIGRTESINTVRGPYVTVNLNNKKLKLLADSGSSVNILDETDYEKIGEPALHKGKTHGKLVPYGVKDTIKVLGTCDVKIETPQKFTVCTFYVVKGRGGSLLGYPTASELNIIKVINKVETLGSNVENDFPHLFRGIGKFRGQQVKIHIDESVPPVAQKPRRTPFHLRSKVEKEIQHLLDTDIIEKVEGEPTPWISPIVTPPKKNGEDIRLCIDMREPNKAVRRERHTMPTIEELILDLNGAKVFSKLDLRSGYHQLELHPDSRFITTFSTHLGIYRYKRLNFGISSASEIFHETIRQVIQDIPGARNISDDIVIFGTDLQQHDRALQKVLQRLSDSGLTLNQKKCEFRTKRISFFGVVFSDKGIFPDPEKVKAVKEFGRPENVKELRSFLGMTNYSSRFIKDYADICQPLRELTHNNVQWHWSPKCEESFCKLKDSLCGDTVISYYDPSKAVTVRVDASPVGLGAILLQEDNKVVCYASRALTPVESRYSQTEREALAVTWACEHFDLYLRGLHNFTIITDHKPLETIWKKPRPPLRIERWGLRLQPYKFTIKYSPGKDNMADYVSRHPVQPATDARDLSEEYVNFIALESLPRAIELDDVKQATLNDITLQKAIEFTRNGDWYKMKTLKQDEADFEELTAISSVRDELTVHSDNILLRDTRIILPKALRDRAIDIAHEGHQGMARTKDFLRSNAWFPGMDGRVENRVTNCSACQLLTPEHHTMEPLKMSELPGGPWENLSIDFCGPLPSVDYLFVIIDEYSRYPVVEIVKSVSAKSVIPVLDKVISAYGIPKIIKSDNGSPFQSYEFKRYAEHMGFIHRRITPRWPRANAQAESFNKPLMKAVRSAHIEGLNWWQELYRFLRQYRATPHSSTGRTPFMLLFNRDPKTRLPVTTHRDSTPNDLQVREKDSKKKFDMRSYADKRNQAKERDISVGDSVVMKNEKRGKMQPYFSYEPKIVTDKKGSMITVDREVTRNMSQFKKINSAVNEELENRARMQENNHEEIELAMHSSKADLEDSVMKQCKTSSSVKNTSQKPVVQPLRRSQRSKQLPVNLKDFVLN